MPSPRHRRRSRRLGRDVKDRLIQTRVPERLESVLKEEAHKQRLTVSHLIRNMLEDTLQLVDTVVTGAGDLVDGSVGFAEQFKKDAEKIASTAREAVRSRAPAEADRPQEPDETDEPADSDVLAIRFAALDHVLAWNKVVVNKLASCAGCDRGLARGSSANLGISQDPSAPPAWLCDECLGLL